MKIGIDNMLRWLQMSEQDVFDKIQQSIGGEIYGSGDYRSLYCPGGSGGNKALFVAHIDTVWNDSEKVNPIVLDPNMIVSGSRVRSLSKKSSPVLSGAGIGADDRAGCILAYMLNKTYGQSALFTTGEESGCLGATFLASLPELLEDISRQHCFMVELDRRGYNDIVFYPGITTEKFEQYCKDNTGYNIVAGSSSDISVLCRHICGVNVSVGYRNEHTPNEVLNMHWLNSTAQMISNWISVNENIVRFEL